MALWRTLIMEIGFLSLSLSLFCFLVFSLNSNRTRASSSNLTNSKWWASFANLSGETISRLNLILQRQCNVCFNAILCQPKIEAIVAFIVSSFQAHGITFLGPTLVQLMPTRSHWQCAWHDLSLYLSISLQNVFSFKWNNNRPCSNTNHYYIDRFVSLCIYICLWLLNVLAKCSQHGINSFLVFIYMLFFSKLEFRLRLSCPLF